MPAVGIVAEASRVTVRGSSTLRWARAPGRFLPCPALESSEVGEQLDHRAVRRRGPRFGPRPSWTWDPQQRDRDHAALELRERRSQPHLVAARGATRRRSAIEVPVDGGWVERRHRPRLGRPRSGRGCAALRDLGTRSAPWCRRHRRPLVRRLRRPSCRRPTRDRRTRRGCRTSRHLHCGDAVQPDKPGSYTAGVTVEDDTTGERLLLTATGIAARLISNRPGPRMRSAGRLSERRGRVPRLHGQQHRRRGIAGHGRPGVVGSAGHRRGRAADPERRGGGARGRHPPLVHE